MVTRLPLPTIEVVPPPRPAEKRLYGSSPDSRNMAKYEIDAGMKYVKTREKTNRYNIGLSSDHTNPSAPFLYLTLSSLRTRVPRSSR